MVEVIYLHSDLFHHIKLKEPLTALKQGISHIADNDLDFTIDYGKQDELGELCRAFETMRGELVKNKRYRYLLSFAAGAMVYVVVEELIPEMSAGKHSNLGTVLVLRIENPCANILVYFPESTGPKYSA